jgi:hypothetical protein
MKQVPPQQTTAQQLQQLMRLHGLLGGAFLQFAADSILLPTSGSAGCPEAVDCANSALTCVAGMATLQPFGASAPVQGQQPGLVSNNSSKTLWQVELLAQACRHCLPLTTDLLQQLLLVWRSLDPTQAAAGALDASQPPQATATTSSCNGNSSADASADEANLAQVISAVSAALMPQSLLHGTLAQVPLLQGHVQAGQLCGVLGNLVRAAIQRALTKAHTSRGGSSSSSSSAAAANDDVISNRG